MSVDDQATGKEHFVVVNSECQYSIWPVTIAVPDGWVKVGNSGTREECLEFIANTWIDMRPKSLRDHMSNSVSNIHDLSKV